MDSITQAALGAAIGEAALGKKIGNKGALLGAMIATVPDLDVLFYLFYDSFDMLSIHRGYSHSILVSLVGACLFAFLLKKMSWTRSISYQRLWLFAWIALFTHSLLDTFTAYGTQLFLPFSDARLGFDCINVVDPVYTIPLLLGLILSGFVYTKAPNRAIFNRMGLLLSSIYLLFTLCNKSYVNTYFEQQFSEENIVYTNLLTMPVGVANLHWYAVAKDEEYVYIRQFAYFNENLNSSVKIPINKQLLDELSPRVQQKMEWFAKDFYTVTKVGDKIRIYNLQVDMRGVTKVGDDLVPTKGYFEVTPQTNGNDIFSSGSHK